MGNNRQNGENLHEYSDFFDLSICRLILIDTTLYGPVLRESIAVTSKTALLNDKFSRAVLFVTILFSAIECSSQIFCYHRRFPAS